MNLLINIIEAVKSISSNLLRTFITISIIAIGILSLIGILTTIEGLKFSISSNLSSLGTKVFSIESKDNDEQQIKRGVKKKIYSEISYREAVRFKENFNFQSKTSVSVFITAVATAIANKKKTNPNLQIIGVDENYLETESIELENGRNFSMLEIGNGQNVAIVGSEIISILFSNPNATGKIVQIFGEPYRIIGVIKNKGSMMGGSGSTRTVYIPINKARNKQGQSKFNYELKTLVLNENEIFKAIQQATGVMRKIRRDLPGEENSFEISQSNSMLKAIDETSGFLKSGGFIIGFITLLGASIGLMNIMMVSVTERTKEIGIRKALGATSSNIRLQFLIEAITICVIGGIIGIIVGIIVGNLVSLTMGSKSFIIPWFWTLISLIISMTVGIVSGIVPAIKASKLDPIESLRYE